MVPTVMRPPVNASRRRTSASAVSVPMHGMVTLGLEQKLIAVPIDAPPAKIAMIARAMVKWLAFEPR